MRSTIIPLFLAVSLLPACGGGSTTTPAPPPTYPSVAGTWTGDLIGATPETSAILRLTIEQGGTPTAGVLAGIHGLWTATAGSLLMDGNFTGGLATDGRLQFTLDNGNADCNFWIDVRADGDRIEGTFETVGQIGCRPTPVSDAGRVELTRQ